MLKATPAFDVIYECLLSFFPFKNDISKKELNFSRIASPACTELEMVMMDWLGKMLNLPDQFLFSGQNSRGGGVIQGTASEATLVALLSARARTIDKQKLTSAGDLH